jgi:hypothetical protein
LSFKHENLQKVFAVYQNFLELRKDFNDHYRNFSVNPMHHSDSELILVPVKANILRNVNKYFRSKRLGLVDLPQLKLIIKIFIITTHVLK